jgi:DNA-binding GntR family transcriptional regulator
MGKLSRSTLAERAYEELQGQILSGHRPAGQRLFSERLAAELSISQTPVKEALARLQRDGLVEGESRRASAVRRFTRDDILQIYEARLLFEIYALSEGKKSKRISADFLERLEQAHEQQKRHAQKRTREDLAEALRYDRQFHERIVELTGNYLMIRLHRTILLQTQTIRTHSLETYNTPRSWQDHGAVLDALKRGEIAKAQRVLRSHINGSRDQLVSRWQEGLPELS